MEFFEINGDDISSLSDGDLRELVARLCEAELIQQGLPISAVTWGGAQEAADGGIDINVNVVSALANPVFIPRVNTGFQIKKNSMSRAACTKEMQKHGHIKSVIEEMANKKGAYIIVSGKDDCSDAMLSSRIEGMRNAISCLPNKNDLLVDFYGRDRLLAWLRLHPGITLWIRYRLGKTLFGWKPFGRWAATPSNQDDEFIVDEHPCVIDVNSYSKDPKTIFEGISLTRNRLRRPGSTVRITGLSGVGKTRFAQALFESEVGEDALFPANVIYADLGEDIFPAASVLTSYLVVNDFEVYLVLDNCPSDVHRKLQKQISETCSKVHLLTIEYDISDDRPEETEVIHLEPASEKTVSQLVQKRFPNLGRVNSDKIAEFSGGNARLSIALAARVGADETLSNFSDEDLFQRLFSQRKGATESLLECAEILSLVYSFNVSPVDFNDELNVLGTVVGIDRKILHRNHAELLRRQLAQQRGDWRAVLPHALANRLAKRALQNISLTEINAELLQVKNLRLLKSCAHRIGYLHDFEPARQLANSWILPGGPLHNISSCEQEYLTILNRIAPVFPETVLGVIELAANIDGFASRKNRCFDMLVSLLCQLAYEDDNFDRAVSIIQKFAETERAGENSYSIVKDMRQLFSLYLSGTQAAPLRRQDFVRKMIGSNNSRQREIAKELLYSAFETVHWHSSMKFDFGARIRNFGWEPKNYEERRDWYVGFILILQPMLNSNDKNDKSWAKEILADNFRGLWRFAGCFDELEQIVQDHAAGGQWPEIWMSIKKTIYFDGKRHTPELLSQLKDLEKLAAPSDPYAEIEAYLLLNPWDYIEVEEERSSSKLDDVYGKIVKLGELAATEHVYLERLGSKLWEKPIDTLTFFGEGLAKGSVDQVVTFELLLRLLKEQEMNQIYPGLFYGYIKAVYDVDPILARKIQERVLEIPELKNHSVYLLSASKIAPWSIKKLLEIARRGDIEAWRFEQIRFGGIHEAISDEDLAVILAELNGLKDGVFSTLRILSVRFLSVKDKNYLPGDSLCAVGRGAIKKLLSMSQEDIKMDHVYGIDRMMGKFFSVSIAYDEIVGVVNLLCEGIESYRLYGFKLENIILGLIENFPEIVLDRVLGGGQEGLAYSFFREGVGRKESLLNRVPVDRLIKWCNGNQGRLLKVAKTVDSYSDSDVENSFVSNSTEVALSEHIKALLDVAEDKLKIIEIVFSRTHPDSWSGSLAGILEARLKGFAELLKYPIPEVQDLVKNKMKDLKEIIQEEKKREMKRNNDREQRFE